MNSFACSIVLLLAVAANASEPRWQHLSSSTGELPISGPSTEQTGAVVADFNKDGTNNSFSAFVRSRLRLSGIALSPQDGPASSLRPIFLPLKPGALLMASTATAIPTSSSVAIGKATKYVGKSLSKLRSRNSLETPHH